MPSYHARSAPGCRSRCRALPARSLLSPPSSLGRPTKVMAYARRHRSTSCLLACTMLIGDALTIFKLNGIMRRRRPHHDQRAQPALGSRWPRPVRLLAGRRRHAAARLSPQAAGRGHTCLSVSRCTVCCAGSSADVSCVSVCRVRVLVVFGPRAPRLSVLEFSASVYIMITSLSHGV